MRLWSQLQNSIRTHIRVFIHRVQIVRKLPTLKRVCRFANNSNRWKEHRMWPSKRVLQLALWNQPRKLPTVSFTTSCWERDWQQILLDPLYLSQRMIANHLFSFAEKTLIINNVRDLPTVCRAAQKKVDEGVLTRYVVAEEIAPKVMTFFELKRDNFQPGLDAHLYQNVNADWVYYNAIGPLSAIYSCQSDYLLYLTGDVRLDEPIEWIESALHLMEKDPRYKVANLTWNHAYPEAKKESIGSCKGFYVAAQGFSDQLFLVKRADFCAPIYNVIREDASHYPRGDVFEKRVFSAMKNRGWLRLTYSKGSYIHENI